MPQENIQVTFVLNGMPTKQTDIIRDKFLVLAIPITDVKDVGELWKV